MGFLEWIFGKKTEAAQSNREFTTQKGNFPLNDSTDSTNFDDNIHDIISNGDVEGRYVDDNIFKKETEEEQFIREQRKAVYRLEGIYIPGSAICSVCGEKDTPLFTGKDGRYYCRNHILPENRGK